MLAISGAVHDSSCDSGVFGSIPGGESYPGTVAAGAPDLRAGAAVCKQRALRPPRHTPRRFLRTSPVPGSVAIRAPWACISHRLAAGGTSLDEAPNRVGKHPGSAGPDVATDHPREGVPLPATRGLRFGAGREPRVRGGVRRAFAREAELGDLRRSRCAAAATRCRDLVRAFRRSVAIGLHPTDAALSHGCAVHRSAYRLDAPRASTDPRTPYEVTWRRLRPGGSPRAGGGRPGAPGAADGPSGYSRARRTPTPERAVPTPSSRGSGPRSGLSR